MAHRTAALSVAAATTIVIAVQPPIASAQNCEKCWEDLTPAGYCHTHGDPLTIPFYVWTPVGEFEYGDCDTSSFPWSTWLHGSCGIHTDDCEQLASTADEFRRATAGGAMPTELGELLMRSPLSFKYDYARRTLQLMACDHTTVLAETQLDQIAAVQLGLLSWEVIVKASAQNLWRTFGAGSNSTYKALGPM
jgi:hypothetical protein